MKQLEFNFNQRKDLLSMLKENYNEFKKIKKVWDAARFAKENEPDKGLKVYGEFYVPRNKIETQAMLCRMYPDSSYSILRMNAKQAMYVYLNIMSYRTKVEAKIKRLEELL